MKATSPAGCQAGSIIQYLDPELVGPLFRFNREFYDLDQRGRPVDYKNLAELKRRVATVMLRRRKSDLETELPAAPSRPSSCRWSPSSGCGSTTFACWRPG